MRNLTSNPTLQIQALGTEQVAMSPSTEWGDGTGWQWVASSDRCRSKVTHAGELTDILSSHSRSSSLSPSTSPTPPSIRKAQRGRHGSVVRAERGKAGPSVAAPRQAHMRFVGSVGDEEQRSCC